MTHYTVDYSGLTEQEKRSQAVADLRSYLGSHFDSIQNVASTTPPPTQHAFRVQCSLFLGVEGYPVEVLYDQIWGEGAWDEAEPEPDEDE